MAPLDQQGLQAPYRHSRQRNSRNEDVLPQSILSTIHQQRGEAILPKALANGNRRGTNIDSLVALCYPLFGRGCRRCLSHPCYEHLVRGLLVLPIVHSLSGMARTLAPVLGHGCPMDRVSGGRESQTTSPSSRAGIENPRTQSHAESLHNCQRAVGIFDVGPAAQRIKRCNDPGSLVPCYLSFENVASISHHSQNGGAPYYDGRSRSPPHLARADMGWARSQETSGCTRHLCI